jgi:hypothetical protein
VSLQPLAILFGACFTILAAYALGGLVLGASSPDPALRFVTGASVLSLLIFGLCSLGLAAPGWFATLGAASIAIGWRRFARVPLDVPNRLWLLVFGVFLILYFFNAMAPEISFDGSRYHLGLAGRYLREGGFHPIRDNFYAALPQGVEMLYLCAFAFGRHSAASLVHLAFLLALVWQILRYAQEERMGKPGEAAALLVFASPVVGAVAASAYIDVALAAIAFTLFSLLRMWDRSRDDRLLFASGLVAGFAFAAKYTAWLALPYALVYVVWKSRSFRRAAIVAVCASTMIVPWLGRNWLWYRNPVAPLFNHLFVNQYFTVSFERDYREHLRLYSLPGRAQIPMQVTVWGSLGGLLGPVFLLSPLALLAARRREGRHLILAALVFGANYFENIGTRFLIPALPFVALSLAWALSPWPRVLAAVALLHAVLSWPSMVRLYAKPDAWHLNKVTFREALRIKPEEGFLQSNLPLYGIARLLDRLTPPQSTIFALTPIPEAYTARHIQVAFQAAGNVVSRGVFWSGFHPEHAPRLRLLFRFPRQQLDRFRLVQTAIAPGVWSIHELNLYDGLTPVPRRSHWSVTASPFPAGIERAVDGRLLSFWMSGDSLRPGQSVAAALPEPVWADSLLLQAAPNQPNLRLRLEVPGSGDPQLSEDPPADFRRLAGQELKRRGIDYLLLFDGEFGADDLRTNASSWGVREIVSYQGGRLYQLL